MNRIEIKLKDKSTKLVDEYNIFISLKTIYSDVCSVSIGFSGLPNEDCDLSVGEATLFQTPADGMFEIRLMEQGSFDAKFLLTQISPQPGLIAGTTSLAQENSQFNPTEIHQIESSIASLKESIEQNSSFSGEQAQLIHKTLSEIQEASNRLGRKDWINYTAGTLTSLVISAALSTEARHTLFTMANNAFSWLFNTNFSLLT